MAKKYGNPRKGLHSSYPSHARSNEDGISDETPSVFPAGQRYEDYKVDVEPPDEYARVSGKAYLQSAAFAELKKRRKRRKILTGTLVSLLLVVVVGAGAAFAYLASINSNLSANIDDRLLSVLAPNDAPGDPFYVLLLGTDGSIDREESGEFGDSFRSDSMMLARLDPKAHKVTMVSIPRDTKVELEGYGTQKINAALAFGGPALAVQTVSELAGVPISHYAEINFDGFKEIVDALGGVEVDVPIVIDDEDAGGHLDAGVQTLDGEQALILCRARHAYDDYGDGDMYRAANQRSVLSAVAQKLLASDPFSIANSISALSECVVTDLSVDEIIGIAQSMRGLDSSKDIYSAVAPTESEYRKGVWYENLLVDDWKAMMARVNAGLPPTEESEVDEYTGTLLSSIGDEAAQVSGSSAVKKAKINPSSTIRVRNGNGTSGVTFEAQKILEDMGYRKIDTGNADSFDYPETIVIYKTDDKQDDAEAIVSALGVGHAVKDDGKYLFESDFLIVVGADWPTE